MTGSDPCVCHARPSLHLPVSLSLFFLAATHHFHRFLLQMCEFSALSKIESSLIHRSPSGGVNCHIPSEGDNFKIVLMNYFPVEFYTVLQSLLFHLFLKKNIHTYMCM